MWHLSDTQIMLALVALAALVVGCAQAPAFIRNMYASPWNRYRFALILVAFTIAVTDTVIWAVYPVVVQSVVGHSTGRSCTPTEIVITPGDYILLKVQSQDTGAAPAITSEATAGTAITTVASPCATSSITMWLFGIPNDPGTGGKEKVGFLTTGNRTLDCRVTEIQGATSIDVGAGACTRGSGGSPAATAVAGTGAFANELVIANAGQFGANTIATGPVCQACAPFTPVYTNLTLPGAGTPELQGMATPSAAGSFGAFWSGNGAGRWVGVMVPFIKQTPTPTATPTFTATPSTPTATPAPTNTQTPVPTNTQTPVPTFTATPAPTNTQTPVPTNTATPPPTFTPTATATPSQHGMVFLP